MKVNENNFKAERWIAIARLLHFNGCFLQRIHNFIPLSSKPLKVQLSFEKLPYVDKDCLSTYYDSPIPDSSQKCPTNTT